MQILRKILFVFVISLFFLSTVEAESTCDNKEQAELTKIAVNVKAKYEEATEEVSKDLYITPSLAEGEENDTVLYHSFLNVFIINITDKIYVEVSNNYNDEVLTFDSTNVKDGVATIKWDNIDKVTTFTIKVFASEATNCAEEQYKTLRLTTPRINEYYYDSACQDIPEFELCQKYVTFKEMTNERFMAKRDAYLKKISDKKKAEENSQNFFQKNKKIIIISGVILIIGAGVATVLVIRRNRSYEI